MNPDALKILLNPATFLACSIAERRQLVVDFLKANPDKHDQTTWGGFNNSTWQPPTAELSCGTAACIAGWAAIFAGGIPVPYEGEEYQFTFAQVKDFNGRRRNVSTIAQEVLGLEDWQADVLFAPKNSLRQIEQFIAAWHGEEQS